MVWYASRRLWSEQYEVPSPECKMKFWNMTICTDTIHWSDMTLTCDLVTELDPVFDFNLFTKFWEVSIEDLQRMWQEQQ